MEKRPRLQGLRGAPGRRAWVQSGSFIGADERV